MVCPDCGAKMLLKESRYGLFYGCQRFPECTCAHGAHPDGTPLGKPANKATRLARKKLHELFDQLWNKADKELFPVSEINEGSKKRILYSARWRAYLWLSVYMGQTFDETHIGMFTIEQCQKAEKIIAIKKPDAVKIKEWYNKGGRKYAKDNTREG